MFGSRVVRLVALAAALVAVSSVVAVPQTDPFAFYQPWVHVSPADRAALDQGKAIARTLPADDGHLALFAAVRIRATADRFMAWALAIEEMKRSEVVSAVRQFSAMPVAGDVADMTLEAGDIEALRKCEPGDCGLKLTASEIASLRGVVDRAGVAWREAAQGEFRRIVLERINLFLDHGLAGVPAYADHSDPVEPGAAFASILTRSPYLSRGLPELTAQLAGPGRADDEGSYLYWSTERYGAGKPVTSVSHVRLRRFAPETGRPTLVMSSQQIFATHYSVGALGLTTLLCEGSSDQCYLAYLNRSQTDVLGGILGGIKRRAVEQRMRRETPKVLLQLKARIEAGAPNGR
jgi:hypothetical protein